MYHFTFLLIYLKVCSLTLPAPQKKSYLCKYDNYPGIPLSGNLSHQLENIIKKVNRIHN